MDGQQQQSTHMETQFAPMENDSECVRQLIKGEHMAIYSYENAIDALEGGSQFKQQFESYLNQHRVWLDRLENKTNTDSANESSFWSRTMLRGIFTWDRITSSHVEEDCIKRIRDGEEMGVKELKKIKHQLEDEGKETNFVDRMIADASERIRNLNQEVDRLRNRH